MVLCHFLKNHWLPAALLLSPKSDDQMALDLPTSTQTERLERRRLRRSTQDDGKYLIGAKEIQFQARGNSKLRSRITVSGLVEKKKT